MEALRKSLDTVSAAKKKTAKADRAEEGQDGGRAQADRGVPDVEAAVARSLEPEHGLSAESARSAAFYEPARAARARSPSDRRASRAA